MKIRFPTTWHVWNPAIFMVNWPYINWLPGFLNQTDSMILQSQSDPCTLLFTNGHRMSCFIDLEIGPPVTVSLSWSRKKHLISKQYPLNSLWDQPNVLVVAVRWISWLQNKHTEVCWRSSIFGHMLCERCPHGSRKGNMFQKRQASALSGSAQDFYDAASRNSWEQTFYILNENCA